MGAATMWPAAAEAEAQAQGGLDGAPGSPSGAGARLTQRALEARRADAARARRARAAAGAPAPALFAGDGRLRLVPRFELAGEELVAHDDLAPLRRSRSAAPGRIARPAGPAAALATAPVPARPVPTAAAAATVRAGRAPAAAAAAATGGRVSAATYRRRRAVVASLFLGALLAGGWALGVLGGGSLTASEAGSHAQASIARAVPVSRTTYVVQPGDTLWSIARTAVAAGHAEGTDVRPIVDALAAERHGRPLEVGETIVLP